VVKKDAIRYNYTERLLVLVTAATVVHKYCSCSPQLGSPISTSYSA